MSAKKAILEVSRPSHRHLNILLLLVYTIFHFEINYYRRLQQSALSTVNKQRLANTIAHQLCMQLKFGNVCFTFVVVALMYDDCFGLM